LRARKNLDGGEQQVIVETNDLGDGIRMLALNRPPANAISRELIDGLSQACRAAREDESVRAIIVTGAGKFFSGGVDLKQASSGESRLGRFVGSEDDGVFALWTMPKPTVAMVNGHAIAGGVIIALACDFRIAAQHGPRFGLNEVAIGLPFPVGAFEIAKLALTNRQLRQVMLQAELCDPARALELGFVDELVAPALLETRSVEMARRLGKHGQRAYAHTKRAIQRAAVARTLAQTDEEAREIGDISTSDESLRLIIAQVSAISKR
jgi:enoyl-CoA hydratase